jgi:hypothetical protein
MLYAYGNVQRWNSFLDKCLVNLDLQRIVEVRYGIQAGMTDTPDSTRTDKVCKLFLRMQKSLEDTARRIIRKKHPLPNDNPNIAQNFSELRETKRKRDIEFEKFMRESSF